MASPHLAEQVGRVLDGRYRVIAPIGTGASAAVYLADDTILRRRVALKVLHAALANDQGFLKRFQAEAHTAAGLSHPNVMRVLDWGEAEDGPFLVLEYLGGGSLRTILDRGKLSVEQTAQIAVQAARALDYAHRRGLIHRDIKPGNLIFDEEGRLAIADFGLARALAEAAWTEPGGAVLGTARYAAPEQVRGYSLDGKADIYALGLIMFEAICGYVPFVADTTIATLMARLDVQLTVPPELGCGPLGPIIEAATHPDREQRIDAIEMVMMLDKAIASLPEPARIPLPGAISNGGGRIDVREQTLLPAGGNNSEMATTAVPVQPLPEAIPPKQRRRIVLRRRKSDGEQTQTSAIEVKAPTRRRFWVRRLMVGSLLLVLLAAGGVAAYAAYNFTGREYAVPAMENMTPDDARLIAQQAGIKLKIDGSTFHETIPAGMTVSQSPSPGSTIHSRQSAHLKISKGPAPRPVENVIGQMIDPARAVLEAKGFVVDVANRYSESDPAGKVLEQTPTTGDLEKGTHVLLTISGGPAPRTIPDVSGLSYEDALAAITKLQLKVVRTEDFSDDITIGRVAGTLPSAGASVERDGTVTVVISKGPQMIAIPSVSGKSVTAATAALESAGFTVVNVYGPPGGTVFATDPVTGTKIKKGSNVALYTR